METAYIRFIQDNHLFSIYNPKVLYYATVIAYVILVGALLRIFDKIFILRSIKLISY